MVCFLRRGLALSVLRMRILLSTAVIALGALLAWQGTTRAALDAAPARASAVEVLVFEHRECFYCRVFRRDIVPRYRDAVRSDAAPLRFIDIEKSDTAGLVLNARIDTVPTAVVMRDGREVDRIVGYWSPANFLRQLAHILSRIE